MSNVTFAGALDTRDLKYIDLPTKRLAKDALAEGDILFNRTNSRELVGKTSMWDGRFEAIAASYFIRLRLDRARVEPALLSVFMNLPFMKRHLQAMARGLPARPTSTAEKPADIRLPLSPLPLQQQFARLVGEVQRWSSSSRPGAGASPRSTSLCCTGHSGENSEALRSSAPFAEHRGASTRPYME